jgi:hypothetical protein
MILLNLIANLLITIAVAMFMIFVFGKSNMMDRVSTLERLSIKVGLALVSAGSLFNFLTCSLPQNSEVIMNVGLAVVFGWGAIFHFKYFVKE